jgi:trans-2,3-dihydro-3-hydroxyanthranilate isomerase
MDPALVAAASSLRVDEIATSRHQPVVASVGLPFLIAELQSRSALRRILPDPPALAELFRLAGVTGLHLYTREVAPDEIAGEHADLTARMVCRVPMVVEDPATGSANCALVALLTQLDPLSDISVTLSIAQGADMGRPSLLRASARKQKNIVDNVMVGGSCVEVMAGTLRA